MRIKLKTYKNIEFHGRMTRCAPGSVIDVGKMLAKQWIAEGAAVAVDLPLRTGRKRKSRKRLPRVKVPTWSSKLSMSMREFWFLNVGGTFDLGGRQVTRGEIHLYGGPNPEFGKCRVCERVEWLSRLEQKNLFEAHECPTSKRCQTYCARQGNDDWTHYHQNFWYAAFVDPKLDAPKCLMLQTEKGYDFIWSHSCDQGTHVFLRQFAQVCQFDVVLKTDRIDYSRYDFAFAFNEGSDSPPERPRLPLLLYGHDLWKRQKARQKLLKSWKPEWFWTPYPSGWKAHYNLGSARVVFRPVPASTFFTRPNLGNKSIDLLVIGTQGNPIYRPRVELSNQLRELEKEYKVLFHHGAGAKRARYSGSNQASKLPYANAWSAFLGRAKYVTFGEIAEEPQAVFFKYCECLGSGAIPIMPQALDLTLYGVEAWKHYIPLSSIKNNNEQMRHYLDNYDKYKHIAANAVEWFQGNADRLLFTGIQDLVQEITGDRYPRRVY